MRRPTRCFAEGILARRFINTTPYTFFCTYTVFETGSSASPGSFLVVLSIVLIALGWRDRARRGSLPSGSWGLGDHASVPINLPGLVTDGRQGRLLIEALFQIREFAQKSGHVFAHTTECPIQRLTQSRSGVSLKRVVLLVHCIS
jgi:hypothetical protein